MSRLILLPLRGRSRDKPRSYRDCVSLIDLLLILLFDIDIPDTANRDLGAGQAQTTRSGSSGM
ncbi:hypothetical protein, partial [Pseudomonas abietaniphila]|uniref:hypothetical protein n=1 Tax=Pseudomonas abietaniphila TaxID=89065 RepID=UPI001EE708B6